MSLSRPAAKLNHDTAHRLLQEAALAATAIGQPQVIVIVDEGSQVLAMLRMDGSRVLSIESATRKAMTAANYGAPTGKLAPEMETKLALATDGRITNLKGGLPIFVEGQLVGGIGIGSGTGDQDLAVATAALQALGLQAG